MDTIIVQGGNPLQGSVQLSGSKNASLPLMCLSLLTPDPIEIAGVPFLRDIETLLALLRKLGVKTEYSRDSQIMRLQAEQIDSIEAPYDLVRTMRASVLVLGPLLAREHKARVSLPGGCAIGRRPVDRHIGALRKLGAKVRIQKGYIEARADHLCGAEIIFDDVTVTGTINAITAGVLAEGETVIRNAAKEPEVAEVCNVICQMGGQIEGIGADEIRIIGVRKLNGFCHRVSADRIECGTLMVAAAITGGDVRITNPPFGSVWNIVEKLKMAGVMVEDVDGQLHVLSSRKRLLPVDIDTAPFPGFATDMQAQFMAMLSIADGTSIVNENIFENRFMHIAELNRMGADIKIKGRTAVVTGVSRLEGAQVMATDLRASASLVLAGLVAAGETTIHRVYHLDRGYERIDEKLQRLGASIKRGRE